MGQRVCPNFFAEHLEPASTQLAVFGTQALALFRVVLAQADESGEGQGQARRRQAEDSRSFYFPQEGMSVHTPVHSAFPVWHPVSFPVPERAVQSVCFHRTWPVLANGLHHRASEPQVVQKSTDRTPSLLGKEPAARHRKAPSTACTHWLKVPESRHERDIATPCVQRSATDTLHPRMRVPSRSVSPTTR